MLSATETDAVGLNKSEIGVEVEVEVKEVEVELEEDNFTICLTQLLYHQIDLSNLKIFLLFRSPPTHQEQFSRGDNQHNHLDHYGGRLC